MAWNYAQLSKAAKLAGGPEKYVARLVAKSKAVGVALGRSQMFPWLGVAAAVGGVIGWGVSKLTEDKRREKEAEVQELADRLVEDIKAYDAAGLEDTPRDDASFAPEEDENPMSPIDTTYSFEGNEV